MLNKIEDYFLNRYSGKIIARLSLLAATFISGPLSAYVAARTGVHLGLSPSEISMAVGGALTWAFEKFKAMRAANPASPTVQTDASKPGATVSAAQASGAPPA